MAVGRLRILLFLLFASTLSGGARAEEKDASTIPRGSFLDEQGSLRPFHSSYANWFAMHQRPPRYFRAAVESGVLIAIGTAYYWVDPLANSADWDYPTLAAKLRFESVRFDNNLFATNHALHPLAGASVYGFARVNGLGVGAAFLDGALASIFWEYALEYREQASVNDMVFTPFGGMAIGEFLFQLGNYLNSAPDGGAWPNRLAGATLGLPQNVHDGIDDVRAPREPPRDSLGFSSAYAHRFVLAYEGGVMAVAEGPANWIYGFIAETDLAAMPGFLRPGRFSKEFTEGNFVSLRTRAGWGQDGLNVLDVQVAADLVGTYQQDLRVGGSGSASRIALASEFRFNQREVGGYHDRFSLIHLPGPHASVWLAERGLLTSLDLALYGDFAAIHPLALPAWQRQNGSRGLKSILVRQTYEYALGFFTRGTLRLSYRAVEGTASVGYGAYDAIQGIDREQSTVARDVPTHDSLFEMSASLGVQPSDAPVILRLGIDSLRRTGHMGDAYVAREERRLSIAAGLGF